MRGVYEHLFWLLRPHAMSTEVAFTEADYVTFFVVVGIEDT
jgi:hypothetical protein